MSIFEKCYKALLQTGDFYWNIYGNLQNLMLWLSQKTVFLGTQASKNTNFYVN